MATCSDCSANPGASTTARYCPSGKLGKVALPSPAVVCTPTPPLSLERNKLTCTPETRSPEGLCIDTLRSAARAAVQHSSVASDARTMNMTLLLCTRKGLVDSSRRSPGWRVAIGSQTTARAFPFAQWPFAKDSLTVARQRGLSTRFPVPPKSGTREHGLARNKPEAKSVQDEALTVLSPGGGVNRGVGRIATQRRR